MNWFECKITHDKQAEDGLIKKATDTYLVDALSFTEAETRIIEKAAPYVSGEMIVANIKRAKISELFEDTAGDKWYRAKVAFITLDEVSAMEKRTSCTMLIQADTFKGAVINLEKGMSTSMQDYEVLSMTETPILDIFPYEASGDKYKDVPEYEQDSQ